MIPERKLYRTKEISTRKQKFTLEYHMTITQGEKGPLYGVEILKKQHNLIMENEAVHNISDVKNTVETIIGMLVNYSVTPTTMLNILDDLGDSSEYNSITRAS